MRSLKLTLVALSLCLLASITAHADEDEPTFDTLDAISRALVAATSELETLAIDLDTNRERMMSLL